MLEPTMPTTPRILLADDNTINQMVAKRIVEKLGYLADVVEDGQAAVAAWQTGHYDLILMDCHMPVLDGYAATQEIRRLESAGSRIPIVALTAHATHEAAAECKRAGMDEHLTKPIDQERMKVCLAQWLKQRAPPIDYQALLAVLDGDEEFMRQLVILFVEDGRNSLQQIAAAVRAADYVSLGARAHSLKGSTANLMAEQARSAAEKLEHAAKESRAEQIPLLAIEVQDELQRAMDFLTERIRV